MCYCPKWDIRLPVRPYSNFEDKSNGKYNAPIRMELISKFHTNVWTFTGG